MNTRADLPNYAFKRIAGQALRPNQTTVPQPLNAALEFNLKLHRGKPNVQLAWGKNGFVGRRATSALSGRIAPRGGGDTTLCGQVGRAAVGGRVT